MVWNTNKVLSYVQLVKNEAHLLGNASNVSELICCAFKLLPFPQRSQSSTIKNNHLPGL